MAAGRATDDFFEEQTGQSLVKATIVSKFFHAWSNVMKGASPDKIGYIDLFSGKGRYDDGNPSTPLIILDRIVKDPWLAARCKTLFNDKEPENVEALRQNIAQIPEIAGLKYTPDIYCSTVDEQAKRAFEGVRLIPCCVFLDPYGYIGITRDLIGTFLRNWGCDCMFFFNYVRIRAAINNPKMAHHMAALFGEDALAGLRASLQGLDPDRAEAVVVNAMCLALRDVGAKFWIPFRFVNENGRTTHFLFFATKHFKGFEIMRDIMAKASSERTAGIPSFEWAAPTESPQLQLLFKFTQSLDELEGMVMREYAGRTITFGTLFEEHSANRQLVRSNYRTVINALEERGVVNCVPPMAERRMSKGEKSLAPHVKITFPAPAR